MLLMYSMKFRMLALTGVCLVITLASVVNLMARKRSAASGCNIRFWGIRWSRTRQFSVATALLSYWRVSTLGRKDRRSMGNVDGTC